MPNGKVDFFHDRKGYGFIASGSSDDDVFFHMDDVDGPEPSEGQSVEFDLEQAPKGPRAKNIQFD
jgi:CspA family cold shock protein